MNQQQKDLWTIEQTRENINVVLKKLGDRISDHARTPAGQAAQDHMYDSEFLRPAYQPPARPCYECGIDHWIPSKTDCTLWVCGVCHPKGE